MNIPEGYSMSARNNPLAGADWPALPLSFASVISPNSRRLIFPEPVRIIVPTMALTMFLRNLSALIVKTSVLSVCSQIASDTLHKLVLLSEWSLLKLVKSVLLIRISQARFIISISSLTGIYHE